MVEPTATPVTFDEIPDVEEYEVKLYAYNGALNKNFTVPENKVDIEGLEPQTSYLVKVRGKQNLELGDYFKSDKYYFVSF